MKQTKILLVCPGNVIRSALGEALLKKYAADYSLPWIVHSAGTNRWKKGASADPRAIAAAYLNQLDLSSHVSRRFLPEHFEDYDVIYTMSYASLRHLQAHARLPDQMSKVKNFMDVLHPDQGRDAPDPWYDGSERDFLKCFETIDLVCRLMVHQYLT